MEPGSDKGNEPVCAFVRGTKVTGLGYEGPTTDPTVMGWKERDWYFGDPAAALFVRNGNAGPTVWADGRVVGGWAQTAVGSIAVRLLERLDRATTARLRIEQDRLAA